MTVFDHMGVTVVCSMSNEGYNEKTKKPDSYQAESMPQGLSGEDTALISVGGVVSDPPDSQLFLFYHHMCLFFGL